MATINTKLNPGEKGYFMQSNKIATGEVTNVEADENISTGEAINNTVALADGSTVVVKEADIFADPADLLTDLLHQFMTTQAPASPPAAQA